MAKKTETTMSSKLNKPVSEKTQKIIALIIVLAFLLPIIFSVKDSTKSSSNNKSTGENAGLTLDSGWKIDKNNQFATFVDGYVTNNTDKAVTNYVQITFTAYDDSEATVGSCLANANNIDARGKWKFHAYCTGKDIKTVRFDKITGF